MNAVDAPLVAPWPERIEHEINRRGGDATVGEVVELMQEMGWRPPEDALEVPGSKALATLEALDRFWADSYSDPDSDMARRYLPNDTRTTWRDIRAAIAAAKGSRP